MPMMPLPDRCALIEVGVEELGQVVRDAHRVEADGVVDHLLAELLELLRQEDQSRGCRAAAAKSGPAACAAAAAG